MAVSMRVLQMQVTVAHRLRDLGTYGEALELLEAALAGYEAPAVARTPTRRLTEQRLVVLFQQLGQAGRAQRLLAHDRPGVPRACGDDPAGASRRASRQLMGGDGLPLMREALRIVPNSDDIYHRITTLFATRLVPADEGEALAAGLAALGHHARAPRRRAVGSCARRSLRSCAGCAQPGLAARRSRIAPGQDLSAGQLLSARDVVGGRAGAERARPCGRRAAGGGRWAGVGQARA